VIAGVPPSQVTENPHKMSINLNLTVETYEDLAKLEILRPEWATLLEQYPLSTTFSTYEWLASWWRAFGGNDRLLVLAFRDDSGSLVGLAPLAITRQAAFPAPIRLVRFLGDGSHDSDNLDMPVRPGYENAVTHSLLDWMERSAGLWDICELNTLPSESLVGASLINGLQAHRWNYFTSRRPRTVVQLSETWESHLKRLSSKERGKIGLRTRRLEKKYQVRIRKCLEESDLTLCLEALFELHGKHWHQLGLPGTLHRAERRQFYRELARLLLVAGRLELWVLELNGRIVAAQFGLRHENTVFSLQEGFDPEHASDSVGYVLRSQVLRQVISDGIRTYDFLGGTDESKMRWGSEVRNYVDLHFARPLSRGSLYLTLKYKSKETKEWLRERLPPRMWTALKSLRVRK
jgi:CelD/BcsL family acetyltransferase involved in cellulose biosynthesis